MARVSVTLCHLASVAEMWEGGRHGPADEFGQRPLSVLHEREEVPMTAEEEPVVVDLTRLGRGTAEVVDALARLQLSLQRAGCRLWLHNPCDELSGLLRVMGLDDLLRSQPRRQTEQREEPIDVQEGVHPDDLPA